MRWPAALALALCLLQGCGAKKPKTLVQEVTKFNMAPGGQCQEQDGCTIQPKPGKWMIRFRSIRTDSLPNSDIGRGQERVYCASLETKAGPEGWGAGTDDYDVRLAFLIGGATQRKSSLKRLASIEGHDGFVFAKLGREFAGGRQPRSRRIQFRQHTKYYADKWWLPEADGSFAAVNDMSGFSVAADGDQMTGFQQWSLKVKGGGHAGGLDRVVLARVGDGKWGPGECDPNYYGKGVYAEPVHANGVQLQVETAGRRSLKGGFQYEARPRQAPLTERMAKAAAEADPSRSAEQVVQELLKQLVQAEQRAQGIPLTQITPGAMKPVDSTQVDGEDREGAEPPAGEAMVEVGSDGALDPDRDEDDPGTQFARGAPDQGTFFYRDWK